MINCACLVEIRENKILLVRVRDNKLFYLPGGKIDAGETAKEALIRELKEEFNIAIHSDQLSDFATVIGDNHDQTDQVRLACFSINKLPDFTPGAEISEIAWFDILKQDQMAPAVKKLINTKVLREGQS